MKRILAVCLPVFLAVMVFLVGWIQPLVPTGSFGVIFTRLHGYDPVVVSPGKFRWTWERLLPTNLTLLSFRIPPVSVPVDIAGTLPSSDLYAALLEKKPDFSYRARVLVSARLQPASLPAIVERNRIADQKGLEDYVTRVSAEIGDAARAVFLDALTGNGDVSDRVSARPIDSPQIAAALEKRLRRDFPGFDLVSVAVPSVSMPDLALYGAIRADYLSFLKGKDTLRAEFERQYGSRAVQDEYELDRLARYGELLTKYPVLIQYLAIEKQADPRLLETLKSGGRP